MRTAASPGSPRAPRRRVWATIRRTTLALPNGVTVAYAYDEADRLTYQYDAAGKRISVSGAFARTLIPAAIASSTYEAANQQLAFGPLTQTFDANGNLLTQTDGSGTSKYTWDSRNRLVGITGPSVSASFAYDALGRRISKTINGTTTTFLYGGRDTITESRGGESATYLWSLTIDETLTRTDAGGTMTYLPDILGSTVALADGSGTPVTSYTYEPFGRTETDGADSPNQYRFTRRDDAVELSSFRTRYSDTRGGSEGLVSSEVSVFSLRFTGRMVP